MGKGLRTNLKERTKAKYKGKDQLFDVMKRKESASSSSRKKTGNSYRFKDFVEIDLTNCSKLKDENIDLLVRVFKSIQKLNISGIVNLTDITMKTIAINLKQMNTLDIRYATCMVHVSIKCAVCSVYF